jgi:hypothetical protein
MLAHHELWSVFMATAPAFRILVIAVAGWLLPIKAGAQTFNCKIPVPTLKERMIEESIVPVSDELQEQLNAARKRMANNRITLKKLAE